MAAEREREYLTEAQVEQFHREGFILVKGLLNEDEVEEVKLHFQDLLARGPVKGVFDIPAKDRIEQDPLLQYPRMLGPERISEVAMKYSIHPSIMRANADLFGEEPLSCGSMYYFKPPGARGQALHQDNYYLRNEPGTCIGCWIAIDPADEENGGLVVVPNTGDLEIQCPDKADTKQYAYSDEVSVPAGLAPIPMIMDPGDALFFNGNLIHGSYMNRSKDRFRRSLIVHSIAMSSERIGYHIANLLYDRHGSVFTRESNQNAGPCGTPLPGAVAP
ncbi:phytanoyl-CoA dioxygenase family protein [Paenibacillus cymbidii]|uniref:phytanoyl-CoA dioxygenase family protein n=1 Tax=Paenibacillus cymbidii TaxID=1639034 RepID=UPI001081B816|nr:phytanoyl-CoA dioxygenase family protein [Paenibacillus cymbidii]